MKSESRLGWDSPSGKGGMPSYLNLSVSVIIPTDFVTEGESIQQCPKGLYITRTQLPAER